MGMIRKKDLEGGCWYQGECRNASLAYWMEKEQCFIHIRHKFGDAFVEKINHPEDEEFFDVFKPIKKIEPLTDEEITSAMDDFHELETQQKARRDEQARSKQKDTSTTKE